MRLIYADSILPLWYARREARRRRGLTVWAIFHPHSPEGRFIALLGPARSQNPS